MRVVLIVLVFSLLLLLLEGSLASSFRRLSRALVAGALVFLALRCFRFVPSGSVGVVDFHGKVSDRVLDPGLHAVKPFVKVVRLTLRVQSASETVEAALADGARVRIGFAVRYRLEPEKAVSMYRQSGRNYRDTVLRPWLRLTAVRLAAEEGSGGREVLAARVLRELGAVLRPSGLVVESVDVTEFVPSRAGAPGA